MARTYKKKGTKLSGPVKKALTDIQEGMGLVQAALKHSISRQILSYHLKRKSTQPESDIEDKRVS